jgi:nucleotide-binding universal stress UspA family protein
VGYDSTDGTYIEGRNILVATDGSEHSNAAVSEAIGIAKRCGVTVLAVSSVHAEPDLEEAKLIFRKWSTWRARKAYLWKQ